MDETLNTQGEPRTQKKKTLSADNVNVNKFRNWVQDLFALVLFTFSQYKLSGN